MKRFLPTIMNIVSIGVFALLSLAIIILTGMGIMATFSDRAQATLEVPIYMDNPSSYCHPKSLDAAYFITDIEVNEADIEVRTIENGGFFQAAIYSMAILFLGLLAAIFWQLILLLKNVLIEHYFSPKNAIYIRRIAWSSIFLGCYHYFINWSIAFLFSAKFELTNGAILKHASFQEINLLALFFGGIMLLLAEIFKRGSELQELEDLTV